ncbi:hypothetical protein D3C76_1366610 [compost metagenome]
MVFSAAIIDKFLPVLTQICKIHLLPARNRNPILGSHLLNFGTSQHRLIGSVMEGEVDRALFGFHNGASAQHGRIKCCKVGAR